MQNLQTSKEHVYKLIVMPGAESIASPQYEDACCGAVLDDNSVYPTLAATLTPHDFTQEFNIYAWKAFDQVASRGDALDYLSVSEAMLALPQFKDRLGLDRAGIIERLTRMLASSPDTANAEYYARIVKERAVRIRSINASAEQDKIMRDLSTPLDVAMDRANAVWYTATEQNQMDEGISAADGAKAFREETIARVNGDTPLLLPSGFKGIDDDIGGLRIGHIHMLVGNSGSGKSQMTMSVARQLCRAGIGVAYFSFEMDRYELMQNFFSMETGAYRSRYENGQMSDDQVEDMNNVTIDHWNLHIFDDPTQNTVEYMRRKVRHLQTTKGIMVVMCDGLWLMEDPDVKANKPSDNYPGVMRKLKALAKKLSVAVWLVHQYKQGGVGENETPALHHIDGAAYAYRDVQKLYALKRYKDPRSPAELYRLKGRGVVDQTSPIRLRYMTANSMYVDDGDYSDVTF